MLPLSWLQGSILDPQKAQQRRIGHCAGDRERTVHGAARVDTSPIEAAGRRRRRRRFSRAQVLLEERQEEGGAGVLDVAGYVNLAVWFEARMPLRLRTARQRQGPGERHLPVHDDLL